MVNGTLLLCRRASSDKYDWIKREIRSQICIPVDVSSDLGYGRTKVAVDIQ